MKRLNIYLSVYKVYEADLRALAIRCSVLRSQSNSYSWRQDLDPRNSERVVLRSAVSTDSREDGAVR